MNVQNHDCYLHIIAIIYDGYIVIKFTTGHSELLVIFEVIVLFEDIVLAHSFVWLQEHDRGHTCSVEIRLIKLV